MSTDPAPDPPPSDRTYRRLSPLTPLVRSAILVVAVAVSSWQDLLAGHLGPVGWVLLALLVAGAVFGAASWLRTKYWIEADELRVDTGLVSRQSRRIRVDRLQGIDVVQPFVARLLGLAELRLDVAGGGPHEGSLAFLTLSDALALRETLLSRRDAVRARAVPPVTADAPTDASAPPARPAAGTWAPGAAAAGPPERLFARLDVRTLVLSLVLSPTTVAFVVGSLVLAGVVVAMGGTRGTAGVLPLVVGWGLTQFRRLSAFYDFTLTTTETGAGPGLHVRRGLFERSTQSIPLARVQGVVVTEPWMWRPFGWARLDVSVAGHARGQGHDEPSSSTVMPVARRAEVLGLARVLLTDAGGPDLAAVATTPPPARARWVAPVRRLFLRAGVGEDLVVSCEGVLTRRTHAVPHQRVQSVQLHQRPWQRLLGLADLCVDSPPGPVRVRARHRDAGEARALMEQLSTVTRRARGQDLVVTSHQKSPSPPGSVSSAASPASASPLT